MANNTQSVPVSQILRDKSVLDEEPKKKSREDWRKAKELEEARKAGTAPAAVDEEGKDINPHIPQYISSAPWYYGQTGPTLKHQRPQEEKQQTFSRIDDWYKRGVDTSSVAVKYRKGSCENCGAITHQKKHCLERPRKIGAKYTNAHIAPDEFAQPVLSVSYDGKRDRWSGYDPSDHKSIIEEFQKVEDAKRQLRAEKLNANVNPELDADDKEEDEDKYVDEVDMPGTKVDSKQRITVRNLRIREDTAKYLRNLDPNSAYYDPKTRSMRDNPNDIPKDDEGYSGENFVRFSGDTRKHAQAQLFAWEAYEKGVDVHLLAEPTKLELLQKEYDKKKDQFKSQVQGNVLERYGGEEHLDVPPKTLLLAQTEDYVEYARDGKIVKGREKEVIRSKYEEEVFINNHTTVWGSFWHSGQWGYKCCHSFIKNSYCLGESGKHNVDLSTPQIQAATLIEEVIPEAKPPLAEPEEASESDSSSSSEEDKESSAARKKMKKKQKKKKLKEKRRHKKDETPNKLEKALKEEMARQREAEQLLATDERKRPYNSMFEAKKPTDEELEAYYMKRRRDEDPMNQFIL